MSSGAAAPVDKRTERQREIKEAAFRQVQANVDGEDVILMATDVEAEVEADKERGIIKAYANIKNVFDLYNDIGRDGCYEDCIKDGFQARLDAERPPAIKVLYQHRWGDPIGLPIHMEEDSHGLMTESRIVDPDEGLGRRTLILAAEGVLDSMSIGFRLRSSDYRWLDLNEMSAEEIASLPSDPWWYPPREIFRYRIYEYSVVTFPGAPGSDILEVIKSIDRRVWGGWRPDGNDDSAPERRDAPRAAGDNAPQIQTLSMEALLALKGGVDAAIQIEQERAQGDDSSPSTRKKGTDTNRNALSALASGLSELVQHQQKEA